MNINELINNRRDELMYGIDIVNEDMKDVIIDTPEEFIEDAIQEFTEEGYGTIGEMYADELIIEEVIAYSDDDEYIESVEEAFKEEMIKKAIQTKQTIMDLAKKFATWIQGLINDISSLFSNGEKLVKKYGEEIKKAHKEKGNKITVKTAVYKLNLEKFTRGFYDIVNKVLGDESTFDKNNKPIEEVKKEAIECIRIKEEKEYKVSDIDINDIIEIVGLKQKIIKELKKMNRQIQTAFKATALAVKIDQKANNPQFSKEQSLALIKSINYSCKCITVSINTYIKEIKAANRVYTAICRKLLKGKVKGSR